MHKVKNLHNVQTFVKYDIIFCGSKGFLTWVYIYNADSVSAYFSKGNIGKQKKTSHSKETAKEQPRNKMSRDTNIPRINEEYITYVSKEIEARVTEMIVQEVRRHENRIVRELLDLN